MKVLKIVSRYSPWTILSIISDEGKTIEVDIKTEFIYIDITYVRMHFFLFLLMFFLNKVRYYISNNK